MKNMKFARTFLTLALVLVVLGSVIGGTIAWFTDEVTSTSNIIKSGTLDVTLEYKEELNDEWENADSKAIFDYKYWEPGYTQVRYMKIANVGSLAFQYELLVKPAAPLGQYNDNSTPEYDDDTFTPNEDQEYFLEDVLEVYLLPGDREYTSFAEIKDIVGADYVAPTIAQLVENKELAPRGVLLPAEGKGSSDVELPSETYAIGETVVCVAIHMQESAGNEYQNLSVSDGFAVQLQATQYTYENDTFDNQYDADATFANLPAAVVIEHDVDELDSGFPLQTAYEFRTTDVPDLQKYPELVDSPYFNYHADFVVTFDNDVAEGSLNLAGQYDLWSENWLSFAVPYDVEADKPIRLLGEVAAEFANQNISINYAELVAGIQKFMCGAYNNAEANIGTTMTVELRIYETEKPSPENGNSVNVETGRYVTLGSFQYTFDSVAE